VIGIHRRTIGLVDMMTEALERWCCYAVDESVCIIKTSRKMRMYVSYGVMIDYAMTVRKVYICAGYMNGSTNCALMMAFRHLSEFETTQKVEKVYLFPLSVVLPGRG